MHDREDSRKWEGLRWTGDDGVRLTDREAWAVEWQMPKGRVCLEVRCDYCGHLLSNVEWPVLRLPFMVWRWWKKWCRWVSVRKAAPQRGCPQCEFDVMVRDR